MTTTADDVSHGTRARCAPPARPRPAATGRPHRPEVSWMPGGVVNSPDGSRSAYWNGSSTTLDNATVFSGRDCGGDLLFPATFVYARDPGHAAELAAVLGLAAAPRSLGATGSTGLHADRLYYCHPVPVADA